MEQNFVMAQKLLLASCLLAVCLRLPAQTISVSTAQPVCPGEAVTLTYSGQHDFLYWWSSTAERISKPYKASCIAYPTQDSWFYLNIPAVDTTGPVDSIWVQVTPGISWSMVNEVYTICQGGTASVALPPGQTELGTIDTTYTVSGNTLSLNPKKTQYYTLSQVNNGCVSEKGFKIVVLSSTAKKDSVLGCPGDSLPIPIYHLGGVLSTSNATLSWSADSSACYVSNFSSGLVTNTYSDGAGCSQTDSVFLALDGNYANYSLQGDSVTLPLDTLTYSVQPAGFDQVEWYWNGSLMADTATLSLCVQHTGILTALISKGNCTRQIERIIQVQNTFDARLHITSDSLGVISAATDSISDAQYAWRIFNRHEDYPVGSQSHELQFTAPYPGIYLIQVSITSVGGEAILRKAIRIN